MIPFIGVLKTHTLNFYVEIGKFHIVEDLGVGLDCKLSMRDTKPSARYTACVFYIVVGVQADNEHKNQLPLEVS